MIAALVMPAPRVLEGFDAEMHRHAISGDRLVFDTGRSISFACPVAETLDYDDVIVVRLEVPKGTSLNENVVGVDAQGRVVWQVPSKKHVYADSPYTAIRRAGERTVTLYNWDGLELTLDAGSGEIVAESYGR